MACLDTELCDKIDLLNTTVSTIQTQQVSDSLVFAQIQNNDYWIAFYLFFLIVSGACVLILIIVFKDIQRLIMGE